MNKEQEEIMFKVMDREHEAIRYIAYALYMLGPDKKTVSLHDCIPFDEFDVKDYKEYKEKAWDLYQYELSNETGNWDEKISKDLDKFWYMKEEDKWVKLKYRPDLSDLSDVFEFVEDNMKGKTITMDYGTMKSLIDKGVLVDKTYEDR